MTVMRETGLIVVSTWDWTLIQLSLQEGSLIEKVMEPACQHLVFLMCVQVAGREYLAVSCDRCENIKLMNLNKQKGNSSESQPMRYEVITAFSGGMVWRMCHGEENRLFVQSSGDDVLELDTSTTTFTQVRTIDPALGFIVCYVPHPHRLLVVNDDNEVRAVSCDNDKTTWRVHRDDLTADDSVYTPSHKSIIVADRSRNSVVVLSPSDGSRLQSIKLPDYVYEIQGLCVYNDQLIVFGDGCISYFSLR